MKYLVNCTMPARHGRKEIVIGSKVSQAEYDALQRICAEHDRSMSYVLRELAMRGLANFFNDGRIRTDELEDKALESGMRGRRETKPQEIEQDVLFSRSASGQIEA